MTQKTLKAVAVAAALSALSANPAFAQAAIQEPGSFAFYHPYLDVLNGGAPTPALRLSVLPRRQKVRYRSAAMPSPAILKHPKAVPALPPSSAPQRSP